MTPLTYPEMLKQGDLETMAPRTSGAVMERARSTDRRIFRVLQAVLVTPNNEYQVCSD